MHVFCLRTLVVFLSFLLAFPAHLVVADEHLSARELRKLNAHTQLGLESRDGYFASKDLGSDPDIISGAVDGLSDKEKAQLKKDFPRLFQIATDYPSYYDWYLNEKSKKEKSEAKLAQLEKLEGDMRRASALAFIIAKENSESTAKEELARALDELKTKKEEAKKKFEETERELEKPQLGAQPVQSNDVKPEPNVNKRTVPQSRSESKPKDSPQAKQKATGTAKPNIFKPNLVKLPLLKVALAKYRKATNFGGDLPVGSPLEQLDFLVQKVADGVVNFGENAGLDVGEEGYTVAREGVEIDADKYRAMLKPEDQK